jgi:CubicO group peptidase (beta-lactamase class C family)
MSEAFPISGRCPDRFARVSAAFADNFSRGEELGAGFAVFVEGECVVDLIGGWADRERTQPWSATTLAAIYSSGKMAVAMLIARAASVGALDYDAPVTALWPAFGANGKEKITIGEALSHQAGLCGFADPMPPETWLDRDAILRKIEAMAPLWPPGARSGYHPQTFGFIADEILRRATGRGVAEILRADFSEPQGVEVYCGLDAALAARTAFMPKPPRAPDLGPVTLLKEYAFLKPWSAPARVSREQWIAAALPASNMHATARALAEIVHPFADLGRFRGEEIIAPAALKSALAERISGSDLVLPFELSWSAGMMRNTNGHFGPSTSAYGHAGFGGSSVMFDPKRRMSCAYVMSKMSFHLVGDPRFVRLVGALYDALD